MNKEKLRKIKKTLLRPYTKTKKNFVYTVLFMLLCTIIIVFNLASKTSIPCYISPQQKDVLKGRISSISASQKVSEYTLFRHMKGTLKYETIGKMPCDKYTEALEYLENVERQVLN